MKKLLLSNIIQPEVEGNTEHFVRRANAEDFEGIMNPVIGLSHFETTRDTLGMHSHKGIAELFYVFEDSRPYRITDSQGSSHTVEPGSLAWIWAGNGIAHREGPAVPGRRVEGIQLLLDAPPARRNYAPETRGIGSPEMPLIRKNGVTVRVLCGATGSVENENRMPQELTLLLISLDPGREFLHVLPEGTSATVFVLEGRCEVVTGEETLELDEGMLVSMAFSEYNESLVFSGVTAARLLFVSGHPVEQAPGPDTYPGREPHLLVPAGYNLAENRLQQETR